MKKQRSKSEQEILNNFIEAYTETLGKKPTNTEIRIFIEKYNL